MRQSYLRAFLFVLWTVILSSGAAAEDYDEAAPPPLRLSYLNGPVSFLRPGADDWVNARLNTPVARGDSFYAGDDGAFELQIDRRAFVRGRTHALLTLVNHDPEYLQFKVVSGQVALDLRTLPPRYAIEIDAPNAVFVIEQAGYYRLSVMGDTTRFAARRGGRATATPTDGRPQVVVSSDEITVRGDTWPAVDLYAAREPDSWDLWNFERTDNLMASASSRYLPAGVYGYETLDVYGSWRAVPSYGPVWIPRSVPLGWAPYSTGSWIWDPYYGWTWIDDAPWGWVPFHYGRWVFIDGYWAWAPGPAVVRPVYAPALVVFLSFGQGSPSLGWVALSWGEPMIPWWGPRTFVGRPWWGGWGGPRVINNVVIHHTTVINVTQINYQNTKISNAVIAVPTDRFGRTAIKNVPHAPHRGREATIVQGDLPVKPGPASLVAGAPEAKVFPPYGSLSKPVVATRPPREIKLPWQEESRRNKSIETGNWKFVQPPKQADKPLSRPPIGSERNSERPRSSPPPRLDEEKRSLPKGDGKQREERSSRSVETAPRMQEGPETVAPPVGSRNESPQRPPGDMQRSPERQRPTLQPRDEDAKKPASTTPEVKREKNGPGKRDDTSRLPAAPDKPIPPPAQSQRSRPLEPPQETGEARGRNGENRDSQGTPRHKATPKEKNRSKQKNLPAESAHREPSEQPATGTGGDR